MQKRQGLLLLTSVLILVFTLAGTLIFSNVYFAEEKHSLNYNYNESETLYQNPIPIAEAAVTVIPKTYSNSTPGTNVDCGVHSLCTLYQDFDSSSNTYEYTNNCKLTYNVESKNWVLRNSTYNYITSCKAYCIDI